MQELKPAPLKLIKKPGNKSLEDFQPSIPSFQPTDLSTTKCVGILQERGAVITDAQHIWALIKLGSYGKGSFSRGLPCHYQIPSERELMQITGKQRISRKRKAFTRDKTEILEKWTKRVKLHSQWKPEQDCSTSVKCEETIGQSTPQTQSELACEMGDTYEDFFTKIKLIRSKDPYVMDEYLHLGAEETFYLIAEINALDIIGTEDSKLTPDDTWLHFCEFDSQFPAKYAVYRHFRMGNWVPKSGLKFGVDFLLYKDGPLFFHSSYAVVVKDKEKNITWKEVIAMNREVEAAGKNLLLCDVIMAQQVPEGDQSESTRANNAVVMETLVRWWVPNKDRDMK